MRLVDTTGRAYFTGEVHMKELAVDGQLSGIPYDDWNDLCHIAKRLGHTFPDQIVGAALKALAVMLADAPIPPHKPDPFPDFYAPSRKEAQDRCLTTPAWLVQRLLEQRRKMEQPQ